MFSMKQVVFVFFVGMCILTSYSLGFSQLTQASLDDVVAVANNWLQLGQDMEWSWAGAGDFTPNSIQMIEHEGELLAYSLPIEGGGYVIVPAYAELPPIVAYSTTSFLDVNRQDGFCGMLKEVLHYKVDLVRDYLANPNPPSEWRALGNAISEHQAAWQGYSSNYLTFTKALEEENRRRAMDSEREAEGHYGILDIGPMMSSSWHQSAPYNNFCPMGDGGRCVVGCVATATAQILYYHRSPISGIGSYTYWWGGDYSCGGSSPGDSLTANFSDPYDWANILDHYTGSETQVQKDAVAELCYEVGVAEDMMYGRCGSGTYMTDAMEAFRTCFGYSSQIDMESRSDYGPGTAWFAMLQAELSLYRPLQYGIYGHSIVCDGWRVAGTNQVHMNYGWDESHNAWYTVDELYCPWGGCSPMVESAIRYIIPLCMLTLMEPDGGESWHVGTVDTIRWTSENYSGNVTVAINFSYPGGYWQNIVTNTPNDGVHPWIVTLPTTTHARIRVVASANPSMGDTSDADFSIAYGTSSITVTSPNGGELWFVGETEDVTWTSGGVSGNIKIELNRDYPDGSWQTLF
ncbi:MAG: C10 family peptidase, partial [bacterium]